MDESYKVAITRLGDRIRVGGTAEFQAIRASFIGASGNARSFSDRSLFPRGGRLADATFWRGCGQ